MNAAVRRLGKGEYYGDVIRRAECCDAVLSVVRHNGAREVPFHTHEQPYFCVLLEGQYSETYAEHTTQYGPFSVALHPAQYSHSDTISSAGASFFTIELGEQWHDRLRDVVDLHAVIVDLAGDDVSWAAIRILREMLQAEEPNELMLESTLYEMLSAFAPAADQTGASAWMQVAKAYIASNLCAGLNMSAIANAAGVHPVSLARSFRTNEGQTAGEYVNKMRIARGCQQLGDRHARIADVATDLGFVDQSHFTRVFKDVTGLTPGVFRSVVLQSRPQVPG